MIIVNPIVQVDHEYVISGYSVRYVTAENRCDVVCQIIIIILHTTTNGMADFPLLTWACCCLVLRSIDSVTYSIWQLSCPLQSTRLLCRHEWHLSSASHQWPRLRSWSLILMAQHFCTSESLLGYCYHPFSKPHWWSLSRDHRGHLCPGSQVSSLSTSSTNIRAYLSCMTTLTSSATTAHTMLKCHECQEIMT